MCTLIGIHAPQKQWDFSKMTENGRRQLVMRLTHIYSFEAYTQEDTSLQRTNQL